MADDYKDVFQRLSDVTHGDWSSIDELAMKRCLHPLHRSHAVPDLETGTYVDPSLFWAALDFLSTTVDLIEQLRERCEPDRDA
jgi:hypothetical protein